MGVHTDETEPNRTELDNRPQVFNAAMKENANSIPPYVAKRGSQGDTAL